MSAGAIGGISSALNNTASTRGSGFGELSSDEFIKVMLTELSNQDPFAPQDSGALLEQLSSLRNIESQLKLQEQIESLVLQNSVTAAAGLIGKEIEGLDAVNDLVTGIVTSVRVQQGRAVLELTSGKTIAVGQITRIFEPTPR